MLTLAQDTPGFEPFGKMHALSAGACALVMAALIFAGWRLRRKHPRGEERLRFAWAGSVMAWQVFATIWWVLPRNWNIEISLPLHVCDVAAVIAGPALLLRTKWPRHILYFWGLGLSTQAFFTPVLREGPVDMRFWLFWVGHTQIVGSALYDLIVRGYRPTWRSFLAITGISLLYAAIMVPFNVALGVNYGYVGNTLPENRTMLDSLGPWPQRLIALWVLAEMAFAALWAIWPTGRLIGRLFRGAGSRDQDSPTAPP